MKFVGKDSFLENLKIVCSHSQDSLDRYCSRAGIDEQTEVSDLNYKTHNGYFLRVKELIVAQNELAEYIDPEDYVLIAEEHFIDVWEPSEEMLPEDVAFYSKWRQRYIDEHQELFH